MPAKSISKNELVRYSFYDLFAYGSLGRVDSAHSFRRTPDRPERNKGIGR